MATKPNVKTFTGSSIDVLNAIRNEATTNYRDYVPVAHDGSDIRKIGAIIMDFPSLQNEFINALVNRIGLVLMTNKEYTNPWSALKRGRLDYGETIEEIFVDLAKPFQYDPKESETQQYKREMPNVYSAFHVMNYRTFYKVTIHRYQLKQAFTSEQGVTDLIFKIIQTLYSSAEYDEFIVMKYLLAKNALNGRVTPVEIPEYTVNADGSSNMKALVSKIKATSGAMEYMTDKYNVAGVKNYSPKNEQYIIMTTDFEANMDVEVLASAFNMDKAEFMGQRIGIDSFAELDNQRLEQIFQGDDTYTPITEDELEILKDIPAMIVDKDYFMILDNLAEFTEKWNAEGLYWNYWYHVWKTFSVSPFNNNALFVHGEPTVTSVAVTPTTATLGAGTKFSMQANVVVTNFAPKTVVWSVDVTEDIATIDSAGTLSIDPGATAGKAIKVTATSTFDPTKKATATVTVAGGGA